MILYNEWNGSRYMRMYVGTVPFGRSVGAQQYKFLPHNDDFGDQLPFNTFLIDWY